MSDLQWENRHFSRDDMHYTASVHEGVTRHSRFSWWQMAVTAARATIKDDCHPSLDASSSYSTASRRPSTAIETSMPVPLKLLTSKPTLKAIVTHMRADSNDSDDLDSPTYPINIDDWPTPPTSAISPTPNTSFSYSQLSWKTHASSIASTTPTSRGQASQAPWKAQAQPSQPAQPVPAQVIKPAETIQSPGQPHTPQPRPRTDKPDIPEKSSARKSASSGLLDQVDQAEDALLQCQLDQLRSEVWTLRHKSSFLEETLKQTVHHRIAVYAERQSISPSTSLLTLPILFPDARVLERGRPVSRSGYLPSDSAFWEGRAPSALGMVPETDGLPNSPLRQAPSIRAVQSAAEMKKMPPLARKKPVLSIMPNLVTVPKTRPPTAPPEPMLRRSISLPRVATAPERARSPTRAMSEAKALQTAQKLQTELADANAKDSRFDRIIDLWRKFGKMG
ncbi:hypothetical protein Slin14017_G033690 [Septoria linicola]|nr:hypothetical protein Slin14017_G033690 [Septoria linicola]